MKRIALAAVLLARRRRDRRRRPPRGRARRRRPGADRRLDHRRRATARSAPCRPPRSLSLGVDVRAASAKAALAANAREMRQVIDAVKAAGGRNVGTQSVSLSQVFGQNGEPNGLRGLERRLGDDRPRPGRRRDRRRRRRGRQPGERPDDVGRRPGQLYRQALKAAVADARLSAETLAAAAGRSLGKVTSVVESGGTAPIRAVADRTLSREQDDAACRHFASERPIEAGTAARRARRSVTRHLRARVRAEREASDIVFSMLTRAGSSWTASRRFCRPRGRASPTARRRRHSSSKIAISPKNSPP